MTKHALDDRIDRSRRVFLKSGGALIVTFALPAGTGGVALAQGTSTRRVA
jgi:hypothetical protein